MTLGVEGVGAGPHRGKTKSIFFVGVPSVLSSCTLSKEGLRDLDVEIATTKEAFARAHKVLQDLKIIN